MTNKGVTLFELLIVIVVMGILAAFSVPAVDNVLDNVNKDAVLTNARTVENAAKSYCSQSILDDCNIDDTLDDSQLSSFIYGIDETYTYTATKTDTNHWSVVYTKTDELSFPFDAESNEVELQVPSLSDRTLVNLSTFGGGNGGVVVPDGPYVELVGDATVYVEIATTYSDPGGIGYDSAGGVIATVWQSGYVNFWALGTYQRGYECYSNLDLENCEPAYRSIIVEDTTPPVISINGDEVMWIRKTNWGSYYDSGAWAIDNSNETINVVTTGDDDVNLRVKATYYVTYTASDSSGNETVEVRTVIVY